MRTSRAVLLCVVVNLLVLAGASAVWVWEPWNPVTEWGRDRITPGMTKEEVEAILGNPVKTFEGIIFADFPGGPMVWFEEETPAVENDFLVSEWIGGGNTLTIMFNERTGGAVSAFFKPASPPTLRNRVRAWLGW